MLQGIEGWVYTGWVYTVISDELLLFDQIVNRNFSLSIRANSHRIQKVSCINVAPKQIWSQVDLSYNNPCETAKTPALKRHTLTNVKQ